LSGTGLGWRDDTNALARPDHPSQPRSIVMKKSNEEARALFHRAGTAHVAVAVDTRPRTVKAQKGNGAYKRRAKNRLADHMAGRSSPLKIAA
jgi:hypothetical protein